MRSYPCRARRGDGARVPGLPRGKTVCADKVCVSDLSVDSLTATDGTVDSLEVTGEAAFWRVVVGADSSADDMDSTSANLVVAGGAAVWGDGTPGGVSLSVACGDLVLLPGKDGEGGVLRGARRADALPDEDTDAGIRLDVVYDNADGCARFVDESPRSVRSRGTGATSEVKAVSVYGMDCPNDSLVGVLRSSVPCRGSVLQSFWTMPFSGPTATGVYVRHSEEHAWAPWRELVGAAP